MRVLLCLTLLVAAVSSQGGRDTGIYAYIAQNPTKCKAEGEFRFLAAEPFRCGDQEKCDEPVTACAADTAEGGNTLKCLDVNCADAFLDNKGAGDTTTGTAADETTTAAAQISTSPPGFSPDNTVGTTTPMMVTTAGAAAWTTAMSGGSGNCADNDNNCCSWYSQGECDKNPFFMRVQCQAACCTCGCTVENALSCVVSGTSPCKGATHGPVPNQGSGMGQAQTTGGWGIGHGSQSGGGQMQTQPVGVTPSGSGCKDSQSECANWAATGECTKNPFYMMPNCQKSCNSCGVTVDLVNVPKDKQQKTGCTNGHHLCHFWQSKGECSKNPVYMNKKCAVSCGKCA